MYKVDFIISQLMDTPSTNDKKQIILDNSNDALFMKFLNYALDDGMSYGMKKLPVVTESVECTTDDVFNELDLLSTQVLTAKGKMKRLGDKKRLAAMCNHLNCTDVVELILKKDPRCGIGARLVNDVVPRHIAIVPYERYKSMKYLKNIDWGSQTLFQLKMNGLFSYYSVDSELYTTRNNKTYRVPGIDYTKLAEALNEHEPLVFIGEGLILGPDGNFINRQTSNGIVNSFIQSDAEEFKDRFVHVVWNYVTEKEYFQGFSTVSYDERFSRLTEAFDLVSPDRIRLCDSEPVGSLEQAYKLYKAKRRLKEEGGMVKDSLKLCWTDNDSGTPFGCKMKARAEVDVEIVDAYYGEEGKQWEDALGGIIVKTCDGKIVSKVGMGFSKEQRLLGVDHWRSLRGGIVTIAVGDITKAKNKMTYAFESSSFIETRFNEKDVADTYEKCKEELANA